MIQFTINDDNLGCGQSQKAHCLDAQDPLLPRDAQATCTQSMGFSKAAHNDSTSSSQTLTHMLKHA